MRTELISLDIRDRGEWRQWLNLHHASSPGVWLVFHKNAASVKSIPYEDSVREALCFGWVDSLIKRLDERRYARKFTPRKATTKWSDLNRKRWAELKAAGLLAGPGLAAAPNENRSEPPAIPDLPRYIATALKANAKAWEWFKELAPSHRRQYVAWIHMAVRPETRKKRIEQAIGMLAKKRKLGLK